MGIKKYFLFLNLKCFKPQNFNFMKSNLRQVFHLFFLVIFLTNCKSQSNCEKFYNEYVDNSFSGNLDLALKDIDDAINCDSENSDYKFEKVKLLINKKDYSYALKTAKKIGLSPVDDFMTGILLLKLGRNDEANKYLKSAYDSYNTFESDDEELMFSAKFNYSMLKNFIEGRDSSLKYIEELGKKYTKSHHLKAFEHLKNSIIQNSPEDVLFDIYDMKG